MVKLAGLLWVLVAAVLMPPAPAPKPAVSPLEPSEPTLVVFVCQEGEGVPAVMLLLMEWRVECAVGLLATPGRGPKAPLTGLPAMGILMGLGIFCAGGCCIRPDDVSRPGAAAPDPMAGCTFWDHPKGLAVCTLPGCMPLKGP